MPDYPKTDEGWVRLAECIVARHSSVSPELVGEITVGATQTIFSWYKGDERTRALADRQYSRDRLMELGKEAGCLLVGEPEYITPSRPFPKTHSDWVSLAADIKEKDPDDLVMVASVNYSLNQILDEEEGAEEAKRWLVEKARELNIT